MVTTNTPTTLNGAWLTQNIDTNTTPGVQLSEVKAALQTTNEAVKVFLDSFNNVPDGDDPTIDTEKLAKLLIEASPGQTIFINTPGGVVSVLDGSVIPSIKPPEPKAEDPSSRSVVAPEIGEEAKPPAPSDEPAAKGALATIKDVSKAFRKNTPEEIKQKAKEGTLTVNEAKMWATTTSKEGRALLGISGRMDAADREILVKQHLSRKARAKTDAPAGADAADTPKKGFFSKVANTVTWPFRKTWEGIKKGWNWVTGGKAEGREPIVAGNLTENTAQIDKDLETYGFIDQTGNATELGASVKGPEGLMSYFNDSDALARRAYERLQQLQERNIPSESE